MRKVLTPILAASLMAAPISATAASAPMSGQAVPTAARAGADIPDGMAFEGDGSWIWIGLGVVAAILFFVLILDDDDDEPESP